MKSKEFVKNKLAELALVFPGIQCSCKYDEASNTHLVEIRPSSYYNDSKEFAQYESRIVSEFIDNYLDETLCFISEGSLVEIGTPDYIVYGQAAIDTQEILHLLDIMVQGQRIVLPMPFTPSAVTIDPMDSIDMYCEPDYAMAA